MEISPILFYCLIFSASGSLDTGTKSSGRSLPFIWPMVALSHHLEIRSELEVSTFGKEQWRFNLQGLMTITLVRVNLILVEDRVWASPILLAVGSDVYCYWLSLIADMDKMLRPIEFFLDPALSPVPQPGSSHNF